MSKLDLKELLEAGAHFGHQTRRWNPKMERFIYGARGGVHIIDLAQTADLLNEAASFAGHQASAGKNVLFVGTKRQARQIVEEAAKKAGMPYVTERWLGGILTNWPTIKRQIDRLKKLEADFESGDMASKYNKKEISLFKEEAKKLEAVLGGIKHMGELPGAVFVVDSVREHIAIAEAKKLGIPVIGLADTNSDPDQLDYAIPANDDALKSISVITDAIATAALDGREKYQKSAAAQAEAEETKEAANV